MSIHRANTTSSPSGRSVFTALAATIAILCVSSVTVKAQFEITTGVGSTGQNFDTLEDTTTSGATTIPFDSDVTIGVGAETLDGWSLFSSAAGTPISGYRVNNGSSNAGAIYSLGTPDVPERALGGVGSAGFSLGYIAFAATNNSGSNLASFTLGFDGEQWRNGGATAPAVSAPQTMTLEYGFGATFGDVANWIAPGSNFNWTSPVFGTSPGVAVDGNTAGLVAGRGGTASGLAWAPGETLWIRWIEINDAGNDHALAIDNFTFGWQMGTPPKNLTWAASNSVWDTTAINWQDESPAASAFSAGDSVNFTQSGLTQNTVNVAAGGVSAGQVTVSHTSGTYTFNGGPITSNQPLQKTGAGTLVLGTTFSQGLNATGGVVRLAAGGGFGDTSSVILGDATTFDLDGNSETVGPLTLTGATVTTDGANLTVNGIATLTDATITSGAGLVTVNGNLTVQFTIADIATTISGRLSTGTGGRTFTISGGSTGLDLDLDADMEGTGRVAFSGAGKVRIGGDNTAQTGGFRLNGGLIYVVESAKAFGNTQLFFNGGTFDAGIDLTGANEITTPVSFGGGFVSFEGEDVEFGGVISFFDTMAKQMVIEGGQTITFSGSLDSGVPPTPPNSSIIKSGEGTLELRADASLYNGSLLVEAGRLVAVTAGALGSGEVTVGIGADSDPDATLTINASQKVASLIIGDNGVVVITAAGPAEAGAPTVVAVPEPGGATLLVCGALGLLARRRRRY